MSTENGTFLVDVFSEPILVKIQGRASYLNCSALGDFFKKLIAEGKREFMVDFLHCESMDSTFLGILAGTAIDLRSQSPAGKLMLCRLGERNFALVENLGLHRILDIIQDFSEETLEESKTAQTLDDQSASKKTILEAHENLVKADEGNLQKFQDVLSFLRSNVDD